MFLAAAVVSLSSFAPQSQPVEPAAQTEKPAAEVQQADGAPNAERPARARGMMRAPMGPRPMHRVSNGREWVSRPMIGPGPSPRPMSCDNPGPAAYGADEFDHSRFAVKVDQQIVFYSPWERITTPGLYKAERARGLWLEQHGYVAGVRTFRNDAFAPRPRPMMRDAAPAPMHRDGGMMDETEMVTARPVGNDLRIEPRAVIRLPADAPRFRGKMRVMRATAQSVAVCTNSPGVDTVRGEASGGGVIRVLPAATEVVNAESPKAETSVASAAK